MDETTPHIHATMVPIVTGERRKAQTQQTPEPGKKSYRKKNPDTARLCADDVMARPKLKTYQNTYAASMQHFGLQRGIEGSEAKHISGSRFYRELFLRQDEIKNQVRASIRHRNDVNSQINDLYENRDEAREKFYAMDKFVQGKQTEAQQLQQQIDHARQQLQTDDPVAVLLRLEREIDELRQQLADKQNDLDILHAIFPPARQWLGWAKLLQKMGFAVKQIVELFTFRPIKFTGKLYSPEFKCNFETADSTAQLKCETNDQQLLLHIDNHEFRNWFKQKQITIQRDNQDEQENRPRKGMEMR